MFDNRQRSTSRASWRLVLSLTVFCVLSVRSTSANDRPNVLVILADDLGYSDLGCYGSEIETPNLDGLAEGGLRFTQFYNTARCWPTRAALLTGYYAQQVRRDDLPNVPGGGRGRRPSWAKLLPAMLEPFGYRSYHSGKWHVDGMPVEGGFNRSYNLADQGRFFSPQRHFLNDKPLPAVERGTDYYATTAIADHAIECLKEHAAEHADRPFFHYLAFTAPHFPLHALPEDIERYDDRYQVGWDAVRAARWERIQQMGLLDCELSSVEPDVGPPYHFPEALEILGPGEVNRPLPWDSLTAEQQAFQAKKMAIHAAMIDRMDREIGRVLEQLRTMDVFDDTLIFFLSDNGASAEIMVRNDGHDPDAVPGSADTHLCLGPGWSTACNTPFRRHKTWTHEGGIATPLIAHWPAQIDARGELRHDLGHVIDFVPTILEVAGVAESEVPREPGAPPRPGKSIVSAFSRDGSVKRDYLWWLHEGNRSLRLGDLKLVEAAADGVWELFDMQNDRAETHNLADTQPEDVKRLAARWQERLDQFHAHATRDLPRDDD